MAREMICDRVKSCRSPYLSTRTRRGSGIEIEMFSVGADPFDTVRDMMGSSKYG